MQQIAGLGRDIDCLAVLRDQHAFGLRAGRHLLHDGIVFHIDDGERRAFFLGDVKAATSLVDAKGFRAWPGLELANHIELGHVHNVDHVVVAAGDVELGMIGAKMQIARAACGFDLLDDLVGRRIDHDDVVGLLVADEDQPGVLGRRRGKAQRAEKNETR
jgi:hypothetical protein